MSHGPIQTVLRCLHNSIQFKLHLETIQLCLPFLYFQSRPFFSFHLQTLYSLRHFVLGSVVGQVSYKSNRCPKTPPKKFQHPGTDNFKTFYRNDYIFNNDEKLTD